MRDQCMTVAVFNKGGEIYIDLNSVSGICGTDRSLVRSGVVIYVVLSFKLHTYTCAYSAKLTFLSKCFIL